MKWFNFLNAGKKRGVGVDKSNSEQSYSNTSLDTGIMISGSGPSVFASQNVSEASVESMARSPQPSILQMPNNLRIFTISELKGATKNFSRSMLLGEGGFGCVYKGTIKNHDDPPKKIEVAVKQLNKKGHQGHREWLAEVTVLGIADHPNLVKLIGYCAEDDERGMQRLLVYEFMPNKSVEYHLHERLSEPLSFRKRLNIALDAAKGLYYLHEGMDPQVGQIIFRDFKTSNILLDKEWNAKLSDFGMARQGPAEGLTHVSTAVVGTVGYSAPEYMQSGHLNAKTDIWSYGIVLLELITGRRPVDQHRPRSEQKLLEWVKPYLSDAQKFRTILDPKLDGHYSTRTAHRLSKVAMRCLSPNPKSRPDIKKVLEMVTDIVENLTMGDPATPSLRNSKELEDGNQKKDKSKEGCKKRELFKRKLGEFKALQWPFRTRKTASES